MENLLRNPILPGFYPDPSVCRRGEDYYLVTSSFEYYPGIPIFHSRDFVRWRQIGHVLDRPEQLNLDGLNPSRGIYAASIFYQAERNRFYVVTTLVGNAPYRENVNFLVWSEQPEGPWSDPVVISGAEGIDPSLVFDGGKAYYLGNRRPYPDQPERGRHIWLQELDVDTGELPGEPVTLLTHGSAVNAAAPEGPHIYHIGDWYYLLIAEGGTFRNHACAIFRSRSLLGPYETNPRNPLLTHRHLRPDYPIKNPGHADIIQLHNGEWWAVLLASRPTKGNHILLGRETFAVPVIWEDEWPLFSADTGRVEFAYPAPLLPECAGAGCVGRDTFEQQRLADEWVMLRTPRGKRYSLTDRPGYLRLFLAESSIKERGSCSFVGRRQQHLCYEICALMDFAPAAAGEAAGILLMMNQDYHIRAEYGRFGGDGRRCIRLTRCLGGQDDVVRELAWEREQTYFRVAAEHETLSFYVSADGKDWTALSEAVDGTVLSRETAGGYTGVMLGMYAGGAGRDSDNFADFDWFDYIEITE